MSKETNGDLQGQIRELQRQIALLEMELGVKKMESKHPALEKLLSEAGEKARFISTEASRFAEYGREHLGEISLRKGVSILGIILALGTIGYMALSLVRGDDSSRR